LLLTLSKLLVTLSYNSEFSQPILRCLFCAARAAELSLLSFFFSAFFTQLLVLKVGQLLVDPHMAQNQK